MASIFSDISCYNPCVSVCRDSWFLLIYLALYTALQQLSNLILSKEKVKYIIENYMRKSTRSILQELSDLGVSRNTDLVVESRGANIIQSAVNLITLIREHYDVETAAELERRFINSIRTGDSAKFTRGIKKIIESKDT